jgi:hypothetical protein
MTTSAIETTKMRARWDDVRASNASRDEHAEADPRRRDDDSRGLERDRDSRFRNDGLDPRDVFMRDLDLPRGPDREIVHDARDREYTLRGSDSRTLSTVGAFRVVSARDLRDHNDRPGAATNCQSTHTFATD